jgi:glycosyltransferase involved in cell wall biosynthesis
MISWDFDPLYVRGGTAYAIRRLADQLTGLGIETTIFSPERAESGPPQDLAPLLRPITLKMRPEFQAAPRVVQCAEFCRLALSAFQGSDPVIAHSDEGAMFIVMRNGGRSGGPSVFWLHSLYDPPISDLPPEQRQLLPSSSLLASAVMMADLVVTSTGILKDAVEFEWPNSLKELQRAIVAASAEQRVLTVESVGCLPSEKDLSRSGSIRESLKSLPAPYVLFPSRPSVDKGLGIFAAIAERLRDDNIACVAVQRPGQDDELHTPANGLVHWLPWLTEEELRLAMRNATCTALPSITEGFGLAAAESISLGVATLYHQVGGHYALQQLPHAQQVPLTIGERSRLYQLWSELIATHPDSWSVWRRHEVALQLLVDKWVKAIRELRHRGNGSTAVYEPVKSERWADKLCRRIDSSYV